MCRRNKTLINKSGAIQALIWAFYLYTRALTDHGILNSIHNLIIKTTPERYVFFSLDTRPIKIWVFCLIRIDIKQYFWPQKWPFFRDLLLDNLFFRGLLWWPFFGHFSDELILNKGSLGLFNFQKITIFSIVDARYWGLDTRYFSILWKGSRSRVSIDTRYDILRADQDIASLSVQLYNSITQKPDLHK